MRWYWMSRLILPTLLLALALFSGCTISPNGGEGSNEGDVATMDGSQDGEHSDGDGSVDGEQSKFAFTSANVYGAAERALDNATDDEAGAPSEDAGDDGGERQVVEPDVIRLEGNILYVLNQYRGLSLIDLDTNTLLSQVPTCGYPRDLYVVGDRAYVLVSSAPELLVDDQGGLSVARSSMLYVVDVAVPEAAAITSHIALEGDFTDSRLVGNVLYAVCSQYSWNDGPVDGGVVYPEGSADQTDSGGATEDGKPLSMKRWNADGTDPGQYGGGTGDEDGMVDSSEEGVDQSGEGAGDYYREGDAVASEGEPSYYEPWTAESFVTSIDLSDPNDIKTVETVSLASYGGIIQASSTALFVASNPWYYGSGDGTTITYVDISDAAGDIAVRGSVQIPGVVADRYKMDAQGTVLRVFSGFTWSDQNTYINTVDLTDPDALTVMASVAIPQAYGEQLYATRFDGDRAYAVTYFQTDPLFVISLADPDNPVILGDLVIPGWSTHIEPRGDRLIALGVDDEETPRKVKVALYDVADPAHPIEKSMVSFGEGWAWSTAHYDPKALTILDDVILVPVDSYDYDTYAALSQLQFISHTTETLTLKGVATLSSSAVRSLEYGANFYAVTQDSVEVISAVDLDAPAVDETIVLAEDVRDVVELPDGVTALVLQQYNPQRVVVRALDAQGNMLDEVDTGLDWAGTMHHDGSRLIFLSTRWDSTTYKTYTDLTRVDASDPAAMTALTKSLDIALTGYYGYGYDYARPEMGGVMMDKQYGYYYNYGWGQESSLLAGGRLVARYWTPVEYDADGESGGATDGGSTGGGSTGGSPDGSEKPPYPMGMKQNADGAMSADAAPDVAGDMAYWPGRMTNESLAIISLDSLEVERSIALEGDTLIGMAALDDRVLLNTSVGLPNNLCASFVQLLNPLDGALTTPANVPGKFVSRNAQTGVCIFVDAQWNQWNLTMSAKSIAWDLADSVALLDSIELPTSTWSMTASDTGFYFISYDNAASSVRRLSADAAGAMQISAPLSVANAWPYIMAADGDQVYLGLDGLIATLDFSAAPALLNTISYMGYNAKVSVEPAAVYGVFGYGGYRVMP